MMKTLQWHGANDVLEVAGLRLQDPLVYSAAGSTSAEHSAILLHKHTNRAAKGPSSSYHGFSGYNFCESYEHIGPASRLGYLTWLQQGRPMPCDARYPMIFLKGLERRVLMDRNDASLIWNEVWRLWRSAGDCQYSFQHAGEQFLWFLLPHVADVASIEQVDALAGKMYRINQWNDHAKRYLSLFLWWSARKFGHLSQWAAYRCAHVLEGARHTVVLERAEEEMRRLFEIRFRERWGASLPLRLPEKARQRLVYQPQNYLLRPTTVTWPDPLKVPSHWNPLSHELVHLYNSCQEELRPLGLLLGKAWLTKESPVAWEALPQELRQGDNPARTQLWVLGGDSLARTGFAAVTLEQVAKIFSTAPKESLSPGISKRLAASLQSSGFCIEPDARLTGKGYRWNERVVLFDPQENIEDDFAAPDTVARYQTCAFLLKVSFYVAKAGGEVRQDALSLIAHSLFDLFAWSIAHRRRFKALAALLMMDGVDFASLRAPAGWHGGSREGAGRLLLQLVGRDGQISSKEEAALKAVWKRLNLEVRALTRELDVLSAQGVVFIGSPMPGGKGEKIPPPSANGNGAPASTASTSLKLDRAAIAALLADTQHVQQTLHEAMTEQASYDDTGRGDTGCGDTGEEADGNGASAVNVAESAGLPSDTGIDDTGIDHTDGGSRATMSESAPVDNMNPATADNGVRTGARFEETVGGPSVVTGRFDGLSPRYAPLLQSLTARQSWTTTETQQLARQHKVMLSGAVEAINDWAFETLGGQLVWEDGDHWIIEHSLLIPDT